MSRGFTNSYQFRRGKLLTSLESADLDVPKPTSSSSSFSPNIMNESYICETIDMFGMFVNILFYFFFVHLLLLQLISKTSD